MMEAAPAASLVMPEAEFLFELLVIALDPPAQFGQIDQSGEGHVRGRVESQYLAGSASPSGHSISSHSSGHGSLRCQVATGGAHPNPGKARGSRRVRALAPGDRLASLAGQVERQRLDPDRTMLGVAAQPLRRPAAARRPRLGGSGAVPGGQTEVCGGMPAT